MSDPIRPDPWAATPTRRAGKADGKCKLVGCEEEVGPYRLNLFYCCEEHGRLANPEIYGRDPSVKCPVCGRFCRHGEV